MANPAQLLHARFLAWQGPQNHSASSARGMNGQNWDDHVLAVRHLTEIEELLRVLESQGRNMRVAREAVPTWYQVVFGFQGGWTSQGTAMIDTQLIDKLEMLAERLEDVVPVVLDDGLDQIIAYIDSVVGVLIADTSLPDELRNHISEVITHVRWCVENYAAVGDFSLRDALERLSGAIVRGAANSAEPSKWRTTMDTFVWPFAVNLMAALPSAGLVALVAS